MKPEELLKYIEPFGNLEYKIAETIAKLFSSKQLNRNDFFTNEGQLANEIGFLKTGIIRAYYRDSKGNEFTKQFFVAPTIIGAYTSLLTSQPSEIIHEALTNCTLYTASYKELVGHYSDYHALEKIGRKIAEHYYLEKEKKLIEQVVYDAEKRYKLFRQRFPHLENQIPQYHIASYIGVSPTQLSRIRRKMSQF